MSADHPNATDQPPADPTPTDPGQETMDSHINQHGGIHDTQAIGTSVIISYNDGTTEVVPRSVFGTTAAASGAATGGQYLANQQAQASLAETARQYNEQQGMDKAMFNIKQQFAQAQAALDEAHNNRDYAAAQHWQQVTADLHNQQLALDQRSQGFNEYTKLADLASNPRNYVQTFFMNRGQQAPPGVAQYGNTSMNASQIPSFDHFMSQFGGSAGSTGASAPQSSAGFQGQQYATGQGSAYSGLNHFNTDGTITLAQNDPDAAGLAAKNPGLYQMGPNYGLPTANHAPMPSYPNPAQPGAQSAPAAAPTTSGGLSSQGQSQLAGIASTPGVQLSDWARQHMQPEMMAQGGQYKMYVPHALVNLVTGKTEVIAGEAGPETASFDGKALTGDGSDLPMMPPSGSNDRLPAAGPVQQPAMGISSGAPIDSRPLPSPSPVQQPAMLPPSGPFDPTRLPGAPSTGLVQQPAMGLSGSGSFGLPGAPRPSSNPYTLPSDGASLSDMNPSRLPATVADQARAAAPGTASPPPPAPVPPALNPLYPENPTGALGAFQHDNMIPPFLRRVFEQNRGNADYGTNTPQRSAFPGEVPVVSGMAWNQMSPSEQQAFLSYVSSYGVDPTDYLNQVNASNPQHSYLPRYLSAQQNYAFNQQ